MANNSSSSSSSSGIGFIGLLQVLFIGLKLTNNIDWSWPWVLSPLIFSVFIWFLVIVLYIIFFVGKGRF